MSDGAQVGAAPAPAVSTLARVTQDLIAATKSKITVVTDAEKLADGFCGPSAASAGNDPDTSNLPTGTVAGIDYLVKGLISLDARHEAAFDRIRAAIG